MATRNIHISLLGHVSVLSLGWVTASASVAEAISPDPTPAPAPFSAVASEGWRVTDASPTDLSLESFSVSRAGFNSSGSATTLTDTLNLTKRVRQDYPNESTFTTDQVAISEPICAADSVIAASNGSTLVSPKPVAAWAMPHRRLVQSTVSWSIAAFHWAARNGEQVACVKVRATNGTDSTAFQAVSASAIDTQVDDANPTALYKGDLDVSSLPDGGFWLEAEVYPYVGVAASVAKSEDFYSASANPREFTRRYFRKGSIPAWVAVESTGSDSTGAISTVDEATAMTTPCLTVAGALKKLRDNFGATEGSLDGCRIVIVDTVNSGTVPFTGSYKQDIAGVVITRATGTTRANAVMTMNANFRPDFDSHDSAFIGEGALLIEDCSIVLSGARSFQGESGAPLDVQIINCNIDVAAQSTLLRAANTFINYHGVTFTNYPTGSLQPLASNGSINSRDIRIVRGVTVDLAGKGYEGFVTIGSQITGSIAPTIKDYTTDGHVWFGNSFLQVNGAGAPINYRPGASLDGVTIGMCAVCQNVIEWTSTTSNPGIIISATGDYGNIGHLVVHHNTIAGVEDIGRMNIAYDETSGAPRAHTFVSVKANILTQLNIKGMVFATSAANNGNEATIHGVSCAANYARDNAAGPDTSFAQAYPGVDSVIDGGAVLFTDNQAVSGTTASPVAGAGGSDLTLQVGSPARDMFSERLLSFDIAGIARAVSGTIDAGAYA